MIKLTRTQAAHIKWMLLIQQVYSLREIAEMNGVSYWTVRAIKQGYVWADVEPMCADDSLVVGALDQAARIVEQTELSVRQTMTDEMRESLNRINRALGSEIPSEPEGSAVEDVLNRRAQRAQEDLGERSDPVLEASSQSDSLHEIHSTVSQEAESAAQPHDTPASDPEDDRADNGAVRLRGDEEAVPAGPAEEGRGRGEV